MTTNRAFEIRSGYSHTLGANYDGEGVNFAIFSAHAERVELCLYDWRTLGYRTGRLSGWRLSTRVGRME
ncbi:TPA: hypothetical protein ACHYU4_000362 [Salmonella enterica]